MIWKIWVLVPLLDLRRPVMWICDAEFLCMIICHKRVLCGEFVIYNRLVSVADNTNPGFLNDDEGEKLIIQTFSLP